MKPNMKQLIAALFTTALVALVLPTPAHPQAQPGQDAAIQNAPDDSNEPTLDDLLGLGDDDADKPGEPQADKPDQDQPDADADHDHDHDANPELTRDLERRLSGEEASQQFEQAIQEMEEVAIRLGDEADPGIDTQRMQDQIILKLEQIISSAEKKPSQQQSQGQGEPKPGQPRAADKPGEQQQPGQQPGEKPGDKPGDQQAQGDKPGDKPGEKPGGQDGQKPGDQQAQGDKPGEQQGEKPGGQNPSDGQASQGSVRNEELTMQDLREGEWGNLPPRLRDELAESLSESFNPVYRAATEAFYRRIAELSAQQAEGEE